VKPIRTRARGDERGAFIVLYALMIVALLVMVAIVVDLGAVRASRRAQQSTADLAALAAGPKLSDVSGGDPVNACFDAFAYIQSNTDDLPSSASMASATTGCPHLPAVCTATTTPTDAVASGSSPYTITIRYPVPASELTDSHFSGSGLADGTNQCERMRVSLRKSEKNSFAGVIGAGTSSTGATAVIRGFTKGTLDQIAALIVLERFDCQALRTSGFGNVLVKKFVVSTTETVPGIVHADSVGMTSSPGMGYPGTCSGSNASNYVVYGAGTGIPSGGGSTRPGQPRIIAEGIASPACPNTGSPGTLRGVLDLAFLGTGHDVADVANGVCPAPTAGTISSRKPIDDRYNRDGTGAINALKTSSDALIAYTNTGLPGEASLRALGYSIFPDDFAGLPGATCGGSATVTAAGNPAAIPPIPQGDMLYIKCHGGLNPTALRFEGTKFLISGQVRVQPGRSLAFPNAQEIVIQGCRGASCGSTGSDWALSINGDFSVNLGTATSCAGRTAAAPTVNPARVVIQRGWFDAGSSAVLHFCQTFIYMSGQASPAQLPQTATDTVPTAGVPASAMCTLAKPCPTVPAYNNNWISSQANITDWSAPNQTSMPRCDPAAPPCYDGSLPQYLYEDLAFWTESGAHSSSSSSPNSGLGGNGFTATTGVFFMPNATFTFQGNTSISQTLDAQFVSRRLILGGQGDLVMLPNPNNAVPTPKSAWNLIR
jgi:Flp pilus assembly protein TadG